MSDIAVDNLCSPSILNISIKQSKTDPFRKGVCLAIDQTGTPLCPVVAVLDFVAVRGVHSVKENKLSVCKLSSSTFQRAPTVLLSVTISADMSWSLKVHGTMSSRCSQCSIPVYSQQALYSAAHPQSSPAPQSQ